jgi:hypothetical protein
MLQRSPVQVKVICLEQFRSPSAEHAIYFKTRNALRRTHMKFRLALFLAGASLLLAMPLCANTYVPGSDVSDKGQLSLLAAPRADFELDSANNEGLRAEGFSMGAAHKFQIGEPVADSDSGKSFGDFSSASSESDVHLDTRMKLHSFRGGTGEIFNLGNHSDGSALVPEPESVSLVLLGLAAIASISLRRR